MLCGARVSRAGCGRVKAAVIESIADLGYQRTTGAEIARRAGVTWGAVQHTSGTRTAS